MSLLYVWLPACLFACLAACLPACMQRKCGAASRAAAKVGRKAEGTQIITTYCRQTGRRETQGAEKTEPPSLVSRFIKLLSPFISTICLSPLSLFPLSATHRAGASNVLHACYAR